MDPFFITSSVPEATRQFQFEHPLSLLILVDFTDYS